MNGRTEDWREGKQPQANAIVTQKEIYFAKSLKKQAHVCVGVRVTGCMLDRTQE